MFRAKNHAPVELNKKLPRKDGDHGAKQFKMFHDYAENGIGPKSFSLGGTAAAQLSASVRERLLGSQSLPKPGTHEFAALFHHHR